MKIQPHDDRGKAKPDLLRVVRVFSGISSLLSSSGSVQCAWCRNHHHTQLSRKQEDRVGTEAKTASVYSINTKKVWKATGSSASMIPAAILSTLPSRCATAQQTL